ncbi:hypothetical protein K502DRAFT_35030 [Neoconidiobolus thromboides FSU 785]|nr:hypothetical protein K502DRAFT_35030 [Neoconidiobolus thromboides FSU 785]
MVSLPLILQNNRTDTKKLSHKRCDRCYDKHIKCSRQLPSCKQCLELPNQVCKYEREFIKKGNRPKVYNNSISVIDLRTEGKPRSKAKSIINQSEMINYNLNYCNNVAIDITSNITRRAALVNLMTVLQYPSLFKPTRELHLLMYLSTKLGMLLKVKAVKPKPSEQPAGSILDINDLIQNAIGKFFTHINLHLSLFTKNSFRKLPRSKLLKMTIIAAGLQWIPKGDPLRDNLYSYFEYQISECLKPSKIVFSLDTFQALLILFYGLFDVLWVQRRASILFKMALRISHIIGLPYPGKFSHRLFVERRNAYNALLHIIAFSNLLLIPINIHPPTHTRMIFYKSKGQCSDTFSQLINYSISMFNPVINEVLSLKLKCSESYEEGFSTELGIRQMAGRINSTAYFLTQRIMKVCANLPEKMRSKGSLIIYGINEMKYFLLFFINTYQFYNPLLPESAQKPNIRPATDAQIEHMMELCAQCLENGVKIESEYTNYIIVSMFNQCFTFMVRYYKPKLHSAKFQALIDACQVYFDSLQNSPFRNIININRVLLNELKSYEPNYR